MTWGCPVRLQHRQSAPPQSKCPSSLSVFLLGCGRVWSLQCWTSGRGPAQCRGDSLHSCFPFCYILFSRCHPALSEPIKCMKRPGSMLTSSQSHSHCKQQQDVNAGVCLNFNIIPGFVRLLQQSQGKILTSSSTQGPSESHAGTVLSLVPPQALGSPTPARST